MSVHVSLARRSKSRDENLNQSESTKFPMINSKRSSGKLDSIEENEKTQISNPQKSSHLKTKTPLERKRSRSYFVKEMFQRKRSPSSNRFGHNSSQKNMLKNQNFMVGDSKKLRKIEKDLDRHFQSQIDDSNKYEEFEKGFYENLKKTGIDLGKYRRARVEVFQTYFKKFIEVGFSSSTLTPPSLQNKKSSGSTSLLSVSVKVRKKKFLKDFENEVSRTFSHYQNKVNQLNKQINTIEKENNKKKVDYLTTIEELLEEGKEKDLKIEKNNTLIDSLNKEIEILMAQLNEQKNKNNSILEMMSRIREEDPIDICVYLINEMERMKEEEEKLKEKLIEANNKLKSMSKKKRMKFYTDQIREIKKKYENERVKREEVIQKNKVLQNENEELKEKIKYQRELELSHTPRPNWRAYSTQHPSLQPVIFSVFDMHDGEEMKHFLDLDDDDNEDNEDGLMGNSNERKKGGKKNKVGGSRRAVENVINAYLKLKKQLDVINNLDKSIVKRNRRKKYVFNTNLNRKVINGFDNVHIPNIFHINGRVKFYDISREELIFLIRQFWNLKMTKGLETSPQEFFYRFLKEKFATSKDVSLNKKIISGWAYSMYYHVKLIKDDDFECMMFREIVYGKLDEEVFNSINWQIRRTLSMFKKISGRSNYDYRVPMKIVKKEIKNFFPHKSPKMIDNLLECVKLDCGVDVEFVNYKKLFRFKDKLTPPNFITELREQLYYERTLFMNEIEEQLLDVDTDLDGQITPTEFSFSILICEPSCPTIDIDKLTSYCFEIPIINLKPVIDEKTGKRMYKMTGILKRIPEIMTRLKHCDVKRYSRVQLQMQLVDVKKK